MKDKPKLDNLLRQLCDNVYFQPPTSLQMKYPAIKYSIDDLGNTFADDQVYKQSWFYELIVIDKYSLSEIAQKVSKLPKVKFVTSYTADNLYHYVYRIYY